MRAGKLDRRIRLERATATVDNFGREVKTWGLLSECWAEIKYDAGNEGRTGMEIAAEQRATICIRWLSGLLTTDRVVYEHHIWEILSIAELSRRDGLEITAMARVDKETAP